MNQNDASPSSSSPISKKTTYRKRKKTLKKKAEELSILCGVPVALVCIEPNGKIETWPEERQKVDEILERYLKKTTKSLSFQKRNRNPNPNEEGKTKKRKLRYETWHPDLDYLPEESLIEILECVERKEKILEERILREKKQRINRGLGIRTCDSSEKLSSDSGNFTEESDHNLGSC